MSEPAFKKIKEVKVNQNLFRGLSPILVQRLYPLRLRNCAEFLAALKIHTEADVMANRRNWSESILKKELKEEKVPVAALSPVESSIETTMKAMIEMMKIFMEQQNNRQQRTTPPPKDTSTRDYRNRRPICDYCNFTGHLARFCFKNPDSERYDPKWEYRGIRTRSVEKENEPQTEKPSKVTINMVCQGNIKENIEKKELIVQPIFNMDMPKLLREEVSCDENKVSAIVDTGAEISIISPLLLEKTRFKLLKWEGPSIMMANGSTTVPIGAAFIRIEHLSGSAEAKVIVMEMNGNELLLGNDLLEQFKKLQIDYQSSGNQVTLGDVPLITTSIENEIPTELSTKNTSDMDLQHLSSNYFY